MEKLKELSKVLAPDSRNTCYAVLNRETGEHRQLRLEDIYEAVKSVELNEGVPDDVRSQFNIARNLAVYSWFVYSFHQVADLKAFSTVEYALRKIYGPNKQSFKSLIEKAVSDGSLKDSGFSHLEQNSVADDSQEYVKRLPNLIPKLRNDLAHGSCILHAGSIVNLQICVDFINQLFAKPRT